MTLDHRPLVRGVAPLTGRTEPWMERLLADPEQCARLLDEFGSPVNLLDLTPVARHVERLQEVAASLGVDLGIRIARKANKAVALVDAARRAGVGVDVASLRELRQSLDAGIEAGRIIVSAAVKDRPLLRMALGAGAVVSVDNLDELSDIVDEAASMEVVARLALRIAITAEGVPPTRFGLPLAHWERVLADLGSSADAISVEGLHFHLNGYSVSDRAVALGEACAAVPGLRGAGHPIAFIDIGGGFPVRYLEDEGEWRAFWRELQVDARRVTWRGDTLGMRDAAADRPSPETYPFWQEHDAESWLRELLGSPLAGTGASVADELVRLGLALHCEPGRAMLDGCGMTLARVAFRKRTSDGEPLVGLFMNRTQLRSTSRDFLVDPRWVRPEGHRRPSEPQDAFLVGAYCIEEELLLRRRMRFDDGVSRDDIAAFVNTGGYLMHILESPSHQIPLAATVVHDGGEWRLDRGEEPDRRGR